MDIEKSSTLKKTNQPTSTGKWWSEEVKHLTGKIGSEDITVMTRPNTIKRKVVILGSSTTEGTGASPQTSSYAGLLAAELLTRGYETYVRGIMGDATADVIARFHKDVVPLKADFCIIALTLGNEGFNEATDKDANYQQFKEGIIKLARLAQQYGMIPVITNQAATNSYDATIYKYAKQFNTELDWMGFHVVDWNGAVDDLAGKALTGVVSDSVHYNNTGHRALFKTFTPSMFERIGFENGRPLRCSTNGYLNLGNLTTETPLEYTPESIHTFTVFIRFKKPLSQTSAALIGLGTDGSRIVINADNTISLNRPSVSGVMSGATITDENWHSFAVSYSVVNREMRFYYDGEQVGTTTLTSTLTIDKLFLGGRPGSTASLKNVSVKDFVLYRSRLLSHKIKALHEGVVIQTSLELFAPLNDKNTEAGARLLNLAPTVGTLKVNDLEATITPSTTGLTIN